MKLDNNQNKTTAIPGPWVAESGVTHFEVDHGLAVIAVLPELEKIPGSTPTRGIVAWVHAGLGACDTDDKAVATARFISAAPDMAQALSDLINTFHARPDMLRLCGFHEHAQIKAACDALNKAGVQNVKAA